jgi:F0F1-type ATP synthase membrane subunit b/b'
MNEIIWLTISFLIVLIFSYKPIKIRLKKFTDNHIYNTQKLVNEAKKTHDEAQKYLHKLEIEITEQNKLNAEKLAQSKHLMNSIKLQSEKEIEQEIKKQLEIAEIQRKKDEEAIKKEITHKFLSKTIQKIVKEMNSDQKNSSFLNKALSELDEIKIKN